MQIQAIPLLMDNYAWLLVHPDGQRAAVVDPSEADPVAERLREQGLTLTAILATHHHHDHVGGIAGLRQRWPEASVIGSAYDLEHRRVPEQTQAVVHQEELEVLDHRVRCLHVPGHTLGAVAYHFPQPRAVFTGDTLFLAGCGRLFEGTPAQMRASLDLLAALPGDTQVYCGHEYTEKNLRFASSLLPGDGAVAQRLAEVEARRRRGEVTVPAPLELERQTNPFLRAQEPQVAQAVGQAPGDAAFAEIRARRDKY